MTPAWQPIEQGRTKCHTPAADEGMNQMACVCVCVSFSTRSQYDEYIAKVEIKTEFVDDKTNHQRVIYRFTPYQFTGIDDIQIKGATLMPAKVQETIIRSCMPENVYKVDIGVMDKVREKIEKW